MKLLFVADGRSPIARSWIRFFTRSTGEVHLISTFACRPLNGLRSLHVVPVAFSGAGRSTNGGMFTSSQTIGLRTFIRHWLGPATVNRAAKAVRGLVSDIQPDLIHAMRIPFEGALASAAESKVLLLVSIWGNDFTLHAPASPMMRGMTRRTLSRASALHADNQRDADLASIWGFDNHRPRLILPGNGGVQTDVFYRGRAGHSEHPVLTQTLEAMDPEAPVVVNPRGFRAYVRNDSFFRAVPQVLDRVPGTVFLCPNMAGQREAEKWVDRLQIQASVRLLPALSPSDLAVVFRRAQVSVSPSEHDGTPNTLLEAMACGTYPVAGELPSISEWIDDGVNGSLVDPGSADELAGAIAKSLENGELRERAAEENQRIIEQRAGYEQGMRKARAFYEGLIR